MMNATIARPLQALRLQLQAVPEKMNFVGNRSAILVALSLTHSHTKHGDQGFLHVAQVLHKCCYFWSSTTSVHGEANFPAANVALTSAYVHITHSHTHKHTYVDVVVDVLSTLAPVTTCSNHKS